MTPNFKSSPTREKLIADALAAILQQQNSSQSHHYNPKQLAKYHHGKMKMQDAETLRNHLALCDPCANQLLDVAGKNKPKGRLPIPQIAGAVVLLLCLGLGLFLTLRPQHEHRVTSVDLTPIDQVFRTTTPPTVKLPQSHGLIILRLNTDFSADHQNYAVEITKENNSTTWRRDHLNRDVDGSFQINIPPQFTQGTLRIRLYGDNKPLAEYQVHLDGP